MVDEFYRLKPQLTSVQSDLLNAFYCAKKDSGSDSALPSSVMKKHLSLVEYEIDWGVWVLRRLDDYLAKLRAEKLEADRNRNSGE